MVESRERLYVQLDSAFREKDQILGNQITNLNTNHSRLTSAVEHVESFIGNLERSERECLSQIAIDKRFDRLLETQYTKFMLSYDKCVEPLMVGNDIKSLEPLTNYALFAEFESELQKEKAKLFSELTTSNQNMSNEADFEAKLIELKAAHEQQLAEIMMKQVEVYNAYEAKIHSLEQQLTSAHEELSVLNARVERLTKPVIVSPSNTSSIMPTKVGQSPADQVVRVEVNSKKRPLVTFDGSLSPISPANEGEGSEPPVRAERFKKLKLMLSQHAEQRSINAINHSLIEEG